MDAKDALDAHLDLHKLYKSKRGREALIACLNSQLRGYPDLQEYREGCEYLVDQFVEGLWQGDTLFTTREMQEIILQAADDLPDEFILTEQDLLSRQGFCLFEDSLVTQDINLQPLVFSGFVWRFEPHGPLNEKTRERGTLVHTWWISNPHDDRDQWHIDEPEFVDNHVPGLLVAHYYPLILSDIPSEIWSLAAFQERCSDLKEKFGTGTEQSLAYTRQFLRIIIATFLIAEQQLAEVRKIQPPRASRKRAERYEWEDRSYISVITLRRKSAPSNEEPRKIDYSHRWIVSSHWRRQWHPSTKTHEWKYIYEFVKGPADKPIVHRERRVFNFKR